jgi:general secretion pathway protein G
MQLAEKLTPWMAPDKVPAMMHWLRIRLWLRKIATVLAVVTVVTVIGVEVASAMMLRHREHVLRDNLTVLRATIREYSQDEHHAPHRLMDLVEKGYLLQLPPDPFTEQADWDPDFADVPDSIDREHFGIVDVHSRSTQRGRNGVAYCLW